LGSACQEVGANRSASLLLAFIHTDPQTVRTAPQTSLTIISVITSSGAEPPKLDRYRNELAASLLGIKPSKVNTEGLLNLRRLAACAPDPEGDVPFLPTTRAVNVVKACQSWVLAEGDDEEMDEEVESAMLPIFIHLAPILQNVPGGHWGFMFDVVEGALERVSSAGGSQEPEADYDSDTLVQGDGEGAALVALARALRLVIVLEELSSRNKGLMAEWKERRTGILVLIRDLNLLSLGMLHNHHSNLTISSLFTFLGPDSTLTDPQSKCRELVLSVVQNLPPSLIDQDTLAKMVNLIEDPSPKVQKMSYKFLKVAAQKRTEYFIIEAGVDTEAIVQATLPTELLEILQSDRIFGYDADGEIDENALNVFGYLLGWMLVFDLFQDAVSFVRSHEYCLQLMVRLSVLQSQVELY